MSSPPDILAEAPDAPSPSLPPTVTTRWSPRRKAAVVLAARSGIISREEAYRRYLLSLEELAAWEAALDRNGIPGLRSTRQQSYRHALLGTVPGRARREKDGSGWARR
jgi:hypothetical protein